MYLILQVVIFKRSDGQGQGSFNLVATNEFYIAFVICLCQRH
jgi:hypothetical protein